MRTGSRQAQQVQCTPEGERRGIAGRLAVLFCMMLTALAFSSQPALAAGEQGHVFSFAFGSAGSGAGEFSGAAGVAVDEATGDVYVVDRANDRIEQFDADGAFVAAWGWGVGDGKKEFELCTHGCQAGIAGDGKGELNDPGAIAVDNSSSPSDASKGDVYVVADGRNEHGVLAKFSAEGKPLPSLREEGDEAWEGSLDGVAVDGHGTVWVYRGTEEEGHVERFGDGAKNAFVEPALEPNVACPKAGFAVDSAGETLYANHERENREEVCPLEEGERELPVVAAKLRVSGEIVEPLLAALDPQPTTGVAVDSATSIVYVDNKSSVAAFNPAGLLVQRFGSPQLESGSGVAVNASTGDVYVADSAQGRVAVFTPEHPGKPTVAGLSAENLTPGSIRLSAQINPDGAETHYFFQYGTADCELTPAACQDIPAAPGVSLAAAFGPESVSVFPQNLQPGTTYFYRVIATNANGTAEGADTLGTITTLPTADGVLADGRSWELVSPPEKDGSGIEPLRLDGGLIQASEEGNAITYVANGPVVPEPEGNRGPYPTQIISNRSATVWSSRQIVTPHTKGEGFEVREQAEYRIFSPDLSLSLVQPDVGRGEPLEQPPLSPAATEKTMYVRNSASGEYEAVVTPADDQASPKTAFGEQLEFVGASPDLHHIVFESGVALTAAFGPGLYEWTSGQPLEAVSELPGGGGAIEPKLGDESSNVRNAVSADGSRIVFSGEEEIKASGTGEAETVDHLYLRDTAKKETLQVDAAVAPIAEPEEEESEVAFQSASSDGGKIFFTDTARLTEESKLAPESSTTVNPPDLYECEVVEEGGRLHCHLKDLTVDERPGENADVLNVIPGASEDGAYVYFIANGVLAAGATPGHCVTSDQEDAPPEATCNLYVSHEGTTHFVATLSDEDSGDWGSLEGDGERSASNVAPRPDLADVTSRVSPNGEHLAFMSDRSLTGYDNVDANPEAHGAHDEEVFLYDAASKLLTCVSCNPGGARPHGTLDTEDAGEGLGLLVDRRADWTVNLASSAPTAHYLAANIPGWTALGAFSGALHQPRYLLDSGRLFFNSPDDLVPAAKNAKNDVYEFEPNGVGSCTDANGCVSLISSGTSSQESAFVDASTSGDDAFFVTSQPLVGADQDTNYDLYDARVCSAVSPCLTQVRSVTSQCTTAATCNATPPVQVAAPGPSGSATVSGPPSVAAGGVRAFKEAPKSKAPTRAQRLASALKSCRKKWKDAKRKRVACERSAHARYSPMRPKKGKKGKK